MQPMPTRSPTWWRVTAEPVSVTRPTISCPDTSGLTGSGPKEPSTKFMSEWQIPQYRMSIWTSWGPTSRRSMVTGASGWPASWAPKALTVVGTVVPSCRSYGVKGQASGMARP